jgi:hypothetical protein
MLVVASDRSAVTLRVLAQTLAGAWARETSADPIRWSTANPAWGQCAVSALVVQDHYGGQLLRGVVAGQSHYWNLLVDGHEVDLTLEQFDGTPRPAEIVTRDREYVLSFPDTRQRYERVRDTVGRMLAERG